MPARYDLEGFSTAAQLTARRDALTSSTLKGSKAHPPSFAHCVIFNGISLQYRGDFALINAHVRSARARAIQLALNAPLRPRFFPPIIFFIPRLTTTFVRILTRSELHGRVWSLKRDTNCERRIGRCISFASFENRATRHVFEFSAILRATCRSVGRLPSFGNQWRASGTAAFSASKNAPAASTEKRPRGVRDLLAASTTRARETAPTDGAGHCCCSWMRFRVTVRISPE